MDPELKRVIQRLEALSVRIEAALASQGASRPESDPQADPAAIEAASKYVKRRRWELMKEAGADGGSAEEYD